MSFTLRIRKALDNKLLQRKQFVLDILHPGVGGVSKEQLRGKLAAINKANENAIVIFGLKGVFGGGRSTAFGLIYDSVDAAKKFEPKYRLKRQGLFDGNIQKGRRGLKDVKKQRNKLRGKAKGAVSAPKKK